VLALDIENFLVEIDGGSVKNVGPQTKAATAKLFHPETVEARAFGDSQVKFVAEDADGNEVQIAVSPDQAATVADQLAALRADGDVFD
jgi:hypothetical protein